MKPFIWLNKCRATKPWAAVLCKCHKLLYSVVDILEDGVRTDRPRTIRTKPKIEEVATLVRANRSQSVDDLAVAVGICHGTRHKILSDDLNMSPVSQHSVQRLLTQD